MIDNTPFTMTKYPLTSYQKNILAKHIVSPDNPICNIGALIEITGDFDYEKMNRAVNKAIAENDALRLQIREADGEVYQYFLPAINYTLPFIDFTLMDMTRQDIRDWVQHKFMIPFDLNDRLFDFIIIKVNNKLHYWFFKLHHIIADGWGGTQLLHKIVDNYNNNNNNLLSEQEIRHNSFVNFIKKDQEYLASTNRKKDIEFWRNEFSSIPDQIFTYVTNRACSEITNKRFEYSIKRLKYDAIKELCRSGNFSEFHFFLGILFLYFSRLYDRNELVIRILMANRQKRDMNIIGHCVNSIPLRMVIDKSKTFVEFVQNIKTKLFTYYRHYKLSYNQIYNELKLHKRDLYDITLSFEIHDIQLNFKDVSSLTQVLSHQHQQEALLMFVNAATTGKDIIVYLDYLLSIFDENNPIERVAAQFNTIIDDILEYREKAIKDILM